MGQESGAVGAGEGGKIMTEDQRKALNEERARNPQVGDMWEDHMVMCVLVLAVDEYAMTVCRKKIQYPDGWAWDFSKTEAMSRDEFSGWLHYGSIPGTWACVITGSKHAHADAEYWRENYTRLDHAYEFEVGG
jgi:hypothetical protein